MPLYCRQFGRFHGSKMAGVRSEWLYLDPRSAPSQPILVTLRTRLDAVCCEPVSSLTTTQFDANRLFLVSAK
jgi:hypothetical protein